MKASIIRLRPPRIAATLTALAGVLYWIAPTLRLSFWLCPLGGGAFAIMGFVVMLWGWDEFRRFKNPVCQTPIAAAMIRTGPFKFTRNPMYLGMLMMLLSPAIWLGSPLFLAPSVVFFGIIRFVFIPNEEYRLERQFKDAYDAYRTAVRRWI